MNNIEITPTKIYNTIIVFSLLAILVGAYAIIRPRPNAVAEMQKMRAQELDIRQQIKRYESRRAEAEQVVLPCLSVGTADAIETRVTNDIDALAKAVGLRLVAVRPQKAGVSGSLFRQPFIVALEGRFPAVASFAQKLGTPQTKLAVTQLQATSADTGSDLVTATMSIMAVSEPAEPVQVKK